MPHYGTDKLPLKRACGSNPTAWYEEENSNQRERETSSNLDRRDTDQDMSGVCTRWDDDSWINRRISALAYVKTNVTNAAPHRDIEETRINRKRFSPRQDVGTRGRRKKDGLTTRNGTKGTDTRRAPGPLSLPAARWPPDSPPRSHTRLAPLLFLEEESLVRILILVRREHNQDRDIGAEPDEGHPPPTGRREEPRRQGQVGPACESRATESTDVGMRVGDCR
ncbi:hypothetical protein F4778DRAFT_11218 [Xylariomycetidae sp. FL2044]|nr:hypothetical protein F4778DRAFT_11218 [Xylariomycetidae sp. FL2044]